MKKLPLVLAALALAASAGAKSPCCREQQQRAEPPAVLKGLKIHEWGVFLVGKSEARAGGGGAPPTFVQKVQMAPAPQEQDEPDECREPVIHVYAPKAMDLKVSVSFAQGTPELAWPPAQAAWSLAGMFRPMPTLSWNLEVLKEGAELPKVPEDHWISAARKAGSDLLVSKDGHGAERFLFYEGKTTVEPEVEAAREDGGYTLFTHLDQDVWVVEGGKPLRCARAHGPLGLKNALHPAEAVEEAALRKELAEALGNAGLSEAEAGVLLSIWLPELEKPGARLLYLLPRGTYDRLLPVTFEPAPEELVRVGLVVRELAP